jgi:hypothetical protein
LVQMILTNCPEFQFASPVLSLHDTRLLFFVFVSEEKAPTKRKQVGAVPVCPLGALINR